MSTTTPHPFSKHRAPHIPMQDVESSQVKQVGYDEKTGTLAVTFNSGGGAIYHYPGVSKDTYEAMLKADSIGSFFGKHIKKLPFQKYRP